MVLKRLAAQISQATGLSLVGALLVMSPLFAADLQTIQQRGRLIVAVKDNLRPLGFRSTEGQLQGFEVDIAQRLARELLDRPASLELKPVLNQDRIAAVADGQVDVAIARVTATEARSRVVSFSTPYYLDGTAVVTRTPQVQRLNDLANRTIAVLKGSSTAETLRYRLPTTTLVGVDSYAAAKSLLETEGAIAFAADASVLSGWVQTSPNYRLVAVSLSVEPLCIVVPKGLQYDALRRRIDLLLERWQREGWLKQRSAFWGLP